MNTIIKRTWNQNRMVTIEDLRGMAFQAESGGHTFEISGINDANEAVSLSGTVAGVFMRPDGADVALTGDASDGVVSVTLSDACYAVAGRFGLYIFVTSDSKKTCVYACIGTVAQTSYGTVAGDTPQDVVDLINAINAAIASIPADYSDLMAAVAPTYSNTALYAVGAYAWYDGKLYRCTAAITTAETWTAAHWTAAVLGDDVAEVKSAINNISDNVSDISYSKNLYNKDEPNVLIGYILTGTNPIIKANSTTRTIYVKCEPNTTYTVSKIGSTRFSVAYANQLPVVGASIYGVISNAARRAITITTGADAAYLVAYVWNGGTDTLTFDEISATIQVEEGATATDYTPFELTAVDYVARNEIQEMHEGLEIQVPDNNIVLGANLIPDMSNMTGEGGSTYDSTNNKWDLPFGGGISQSISVEKGYYLIQITEVIGSQDIDHSIDPHLQYATITYSLGNASYKGYALIDSEFVCVLYASTAGTAMLKIELQSNLSLSIDSVSVRHVDKFLVSPAKFDTASIMVSNEGKLIGIGGQKLSVFGTSNTCFGHNAQYSLNAGSNNTAIGAFAQSGIKSGQGNTAVGNRTQANMQMGTFNNAFGTVAQGNGNFEGSWNNAFGNEAQRDITTGSNNTAMGRRAQSLITTGNDNTAIGSFAGFAQHNANISDGSYATKTASYQTLIGAESIQGTPNTEPQDYATALGYYTRANEKALALGALAQATGEKSVAIGYGVHATHDHEVVIGDSESILVICGKRIVFNSDHTVTWEDVT